MCLLSHLDEHKEQAAQEYKREEGRRAEDTASDMAEGGRWPASWWKAPVFD